MVGRMLCLTRQLDSVIVTLVDKSLKANKRLSDKWTLIF